MKKAIQKEILAKLEEIIDTEIEVMGGEYTVAEIASEVLLQANMQIGT